MSGLMDVTVKSYFPNPFHYLDDALTDNPSLKILLNIILFCKNSIKEFFNQLVLTALEIRQRVYITIYII